MLEWQGKVYAKAGRVRWMRPGQWDIMFGFSYEPKRPDSLVEGDIIPASIMIRFLVFWVELTYKGVEQLEQEEDGLRAVRRL